MLRIVAESWAKSAGVTEDAADGGAAQEVDGRVQEVDEEENGSESYSGTTGFGGQRIDLK